MGEGGVGVRVERGGRQQAAASQGTIPAAASRRRALPNDVRRRRRGGMVEVGAVVAAPRVPPESPRKETTRGPEFLEIRFSHHAGSFHGTDYRSHIKVKDILLSS
jgi:hypothetical protein